MSCKIPNVEVKIKGVSGKNNKKIPFSCNRLQLNVVFLIKLLFEVSYLLFRANLNSSSTPIVSGKYLTTCIKKRGEDFTYLTMF